MKEPDQIPEPNTLWTHKTGNDYIVNCIANMHSERLDEYPITVVYTRLSDTTTWSRPYSKWHNSFTRKVVHHLF